MRSKNIFNKTILFLSILLLFFSLVNFGFGKDTTTLKFASGMAGGGWYSAMSSIAELVKDNAPEIDIKVIPGGGLANPPRIGNNESQLGCSFPFIIADALEGKDIYAGNAYPDIRALGTGFGFDQEQFVIAQDKKISSIDEIFQNKIPLNFGFLERGASEEFKARKLLEYYGLTYDDLKSWGGKVYNAAYTDLIKLMKDRHIDVVYVSGPIPSAYVTEMNIGRPIKLLPFPEGFRDMMVEKYFFVKSVIPKGSYSDTAAPADIPSLVALTTLIVNKNVPDDIVYTITKILGDNKETVRNLSVYFVKFDPARCWKGCGAPLHPGAEKYYKEAGYMK